MAEPVELFTCDHDFDPGDEGKPVIGIWLARRDAPLPRYWRDELPGDYELVGTARTVEPTEGVRILSFGQEHAVRQLPASSKSPGSREPPTGGSP